MPQNRDQSPGIAPRRIHDGPNDAVDEREVQTRLAAALRDAIQCGRLYLAERLAEAAWRCSPRDSELSLELARLRLAQNNAEGALALLDGIPEHSVESGLLRTVCLLRLDRAPEAHLATARLIRAGCMDRAVRLLHGRLEAETSGPDAARRAIGGRINTPSDSDEIDPELSVFTLLLRAEQAARYAPEGACPPAMTDADVRLSALAVSRSMRLAIDTMLLSFGWRFDAMDTSSFASERIIDSLARDLRQCPDLALSLASAQVASCDPPTAHLLRDALRRIVEGDESPAAALHVALATVSHVTDGPAVALACVERGLHQHPWSAALARLNIELRSHSDPSACDESTIDGTTIIARIGPYATTGVSEAEDRAA